MKKDKEREGDIERKGDEERERDWALKNFPSLQLCFGVGLVCFISITAGKLICDIKLIIK